MVINAALSDASQITKATMLQGAVSGLPKKYDLRLRWITFLHRNDVIKLQNIFICEKHFDDRILNKNGKRTRLIINKQPIPSILSDTQRSFHRKFSQQYRRLENLLQERYRKKINFNNNHDNHDLLLNKYCLLRTIP